MKQTQNIWKNLILLDTPWATAPLSWRERVALVPTGRGYRREVLYGVSLSSDRGITLVKHMNEMKKREEIRRITTRSEARKEKEEEQEEAQNLLVARPHLTPVLSPSVVEEVVKKSIGVSGICNVVRPGSGCGHLVMCATSC